MICRWQAPDSHAGGLNRHAHAGVFDESGNVTYSLRENTRAGELLERPRDEFRFRLARSSRASF